MSLEKVGNFLCVTENNTASGISGNGVTEPIGLDSNVYPEYNETCLFSSVYSCQTGNLSDSFAKYQRLRLRVGWHNNSTTVNEGDSYLEVTPSPVSGSNVAAIWNVGTGTPGYICVGRINFPTLSSFNGTYGKLCDMNGNTGNTGWEGKLRPIKEIWGINKKAPYKLTVLPSEHGSAQASKLTGYTYDQITMSNTPDEGWYFSGYNVTGATVNGNIITLQDQDASAQAGFTDAGFPITYQNDGHGTLTGDTDIGIPGQPVNLTTSYNTYYRFSGYQVTGGYIQDGKLYATAACTAKAVYKPNAFTATGNFAFTSQTANSFNKTFNGKIRARTGDLPAGWGANGADFKPSNASSYGITANVKFTATCPRKLWVTATFKCGGTNITSVAAENGSVSNNGTVYPAINKSTTTQGLPAINLTATGYYTNKVTCNSMSPNGWTAKGYAP